MIVEVEVDRTRLNGFCLRDLDEAVVEDLAKSIGEAGLLQPIVVRPLSTAINSCLGRAGWRPAPLQPSTP